MDLFIKMPLGLNKILKIIIVILLILLAVLSVYYKYDNCSVCKFEYEGEEINSREFMDIYQGECFKVGTPSLGDFNLSAGEIGG